ncbi:MAG: hypothetical protein ACLQER_16690 [Streptosporangiaceae bacterium]
MRGFRRLAALTAVTASAGLLLVSGSGIASATAKPAASVRLSGGDTRVTTGPGIATALLSHQIVPLAVSPGHQWLIVRRGQPAVNFEFPVTGSRVSLNPVGGYIDHRGGILFVNIRNGKQIEVSNFIINLNKSDLTGIVNGNGRVRVPVFSLSLAHATLKAGPHSVEATGIVVTLTKAAAGALNASLGTNLFSGGLRIGTAGTELRF